MIVKVCHDVDVGIVFLDQIRPAAHFAFIIMISLKHIAAAKAVRVKEKMLVKKLEFRKFRAPHTAEGERLSTSDVAFDQLIGFRIGWRFLTHKFAERIVTAAHLVTQLMMDMF